MRIATEREIDYMKIETRREKYEIETERKIDYMKIIKVLKVPEDKTERRGLALVCPLVLVRYPLSRNSFHCPLEIPRNITY